MTALLDPAGWLPAGEVAAALGPLRLAAGAAFVAVLLWLALTDLRIRRLPDRVVLPTLWTGLILNAAFSPFASPAEAVLGAAAGYLSLLALSAIWAGRGARAAFGGGDLKTAAMIGAWLGLPALPVVLPVAFMAGTLAVLPGLLARRLGMGQEVPFGPALAFGGILALVAGPELAGWLFGAG